MIVSTQHDALIIHEGHVKDVLHTFSRPGPFLSGVAAAMSPPTLTMMADSSDPHVTHEDACRLHTN